MGYRTIYSHTDAKYKQIVADCAVDVSVLQRVCELLSRRIDRCEKSCCLTRHVQSLNTSPVHKVNIMKTLIRLTLLGLVLQCGLHMAAAQGTAFTYQGLLNTGSGPVTGNYDVAFSVWSAASGPTQVSGAITNALVVSQGLVTVTLDFGAGIFTGAERWLEIRVRTNGAAAFATLSPRQKIVATPYAMTAGNLTGVVSNSSLAGTYSNPVVFNNAGNSFSGNGAGLANVDAATLGGLGPGAFWRLTGNTVSAGQFLGSVNNQPVTFKVNNVTALQITSGTTLPNIVGGVAAFRPSVLASGVSGAVIAGGNAPSGGVSGFGGGDFHAVYDNDGTVSGGFGNKVGSDNGNLTDAAFATVGGGVFNAATNYAAMVGGGDGNLSGGSRSVVAGGYGNWATADFSAVGGGLQNVIQPGAHRSTISGGSNNLIQAAVIDSIIGGGGANTIKLGPFGTMAATIGGGLGNTVETGDPRFATIAGGANNKVSEVGSTVSGGLGNLSSGAGAVVGGGNQNTSSGGQATVAGGIQNSATAQNATVGGGSNNQSTNSHATVGGGSINISGGFGSTVAGGGGNRSTAQYATIGGGSDNGSSGFNATVPGGSFNIAGGSYSFAAGRRAKANHDGSFVWADSQFADFASAANNEVSFRCLGGTRFTSGSGGANQTVSWAPGSGSWSFSSDRELKEGFEAVDGAAVLEKLAEMPISEWNYKGYPQRHIGPMAQDFHAAFPLNESTTTLNDADLHGVALAAIQGLNSKLEQGNKDKDAEIQTLKQEIAELKKLVEALSHRHNGDK
jgi:trimeric autotransporter adhesin